MKKIIVIISLLAVFTGCSNTASNSPKAVVASFIEASKKGDMESLKKYITSQDISLLEMAESFTNQFDTAKGSKMKDKMASEFKDKMKEVTVDIKEEKIEGDNATVNADFISNGKKEGHPFILKKENNQWKISLMSTGMGASGMSQEKMDEGMKQMKEGFKNMDGLKDSISKAMDKMKNINTDSLKQLLKDSKVDLDKIKQAIK